MKLNDCIRITRQNVFMTQEEFAKSLNVSVCTVNRWEMGKAKPNNQAMKSIKIFCETNEISFDDVKAAWILSTEDR